MKKKLLSILLTMCMLFSFLHITTFANTSGITVYVRSPLGKSTQITASGDTTIKYIKDKIAKDFKVTLDNTYRLCCLELESDYRELKDENKTLNYYNFKSGYTIYLERSSWVSTADNPVTVMGLTISGGTGAQEPYGTYSNSDYEWNYTTKTIVVNTKTKIIISGKADDDVSIVVRAGSFWHSITLDNVTMNKSGSACITLNSNAKLDLTLKGTNFLTSNEKFENGNNNKAPAIELCNSGSQLRTKGDNTGTLTATSNCDGMPGIGTEDEEAQVLGILINGGNVIANGGKNAPGIRTNYLYVGEGTVTANPGSGNNVGVLVYNTGKVTKVDEGRFMVTPDTKAVIGGTVSAKEIRNNGILTFSTYDNLPDSTVYNHESSTKGKVYVNTDRYIYSTSQSKWMLPDYTVKFNTDGGNTLNDKTIKWTDKVLNGIENPTKPGWIFKDWKYGDVTVKSTTTYADLAENDDTESITLKANWQQGPANTLRLNGNGGLGQSGNTSSDSYTNALTVTAKSNPFTKIGYTFTEWNTKADGTGDSYKVGENVGFEVAHNGEVLVLYAIWTENSNYTVKFETDGGDALNDKTNIKWSDNVLDGVDTPTKSGWEFVEWKYGDITVTSDTTYADLVTDDKITDITLTAEWNDVEKPVISGIENGKTYCLAQTVTVSDNDGIATVTVNETPVELKDGKFTLTYADGEQKIVVTDKTGNTTEMTVTVNDGHTYEWQSENGQYWQKCTVCDHETAKKDIPEITINGANKVCVTQDYTFTFTLPDGVTYPKAAYYPSENEYFLSFTENNGVYSATVSHTEYIANSTVVNFFVKAFAKTAEGFEFQVSKEVRFQQEHIGGTADCMHKAKCEVCGEEYGEVNADDHITLKHIAAKAATVDAEGNTEYWYCEECGKYFSDKDGKTEIKLADTVIAKLTKTDDTTSVDDKSETSPKTGTSENFEIPFMLVVLLYTVLRLTVIKKLKHTKKS